jgi:CDP-diacylglycerol--glycerol-3-phosphate 3-phosphatidyltransferase
LTLANQVTLGRISLIPLILLLLYFRLYGLAAICFLIVSLSDLIDGYIARRFNQVSDLGKALDPLADKVLVITVLIALVDLGRVASIPVIIIVVRELLVAGLRSDAPEVFGAIPLAKWKTAAQVLAVFMLMLNLPLADLVLWVSIILSLISGGRYLWQSKILEQLKLN